MGDVLGSIYSDPDTGQRITTHSMIKTFRRCPKQAEYKYVERLKPKVLGRPLRLGTWMHSLQEVHGNGGNWREKHQEIIDEKWSKLFDEEKEDIGDLPGHCERLMVSYLWHYHGEEWKYLENEFVIEVELPDGSLYRCKIDALVENQFGLWIVDRKWHRTLPDLTYRILDAQSALYVWAALKNKIPVQGHIWDYGRSKPPTIPLITKTGLVGRWDRLDTDYPTMVKFFKEHFDGQVPARYRPKMRFLKGMQYEQGAPQHSTYFRRSVLEKSTAMLTRVAREGFHTHKRMHGYPFDQVSMVERVPDRSCTFMCSYTDICTAELVTGERPVNWRSRYRTADPMEYYNDELPEKEEER